MTNSRDPCSAIVCTAGANRWNGRAGFASTEVIAEGY